jgi:hypothetical protein
MSPRAACRLEALGFAQVYDYLPGKADRMARGLPIEGANADLATAGRVARDDVVTCGAHEPVTELRERIERSPYGFALVTSAGGIVPGRLRASAIREAGDARAEDLMQPGPSTVRPDVPASGLARRLADRELRTAIVTTP